jgi:hypothetical protein
MSYSDSLDNITLDSDDILTIERFENNYYNHKNNVLQIGGNIIEEEFKKHLLAIFMFIIEKIRSEEINKTNVHEILGEKKKEDEEIPQFNILDGRTWPILKPIIKIFGGGNKKKLKKNIIRLYNCYILSQNQNGGADNKLSLTIKKRLDKKITELKNLEGGGLSESAPGSVPRRSSSLKPLLLENGTEKEYINKSKELLNEKLEEILKVLQQNIDEINKLFNLDELTKMLNIKNIKSYLDNLPNIRLIILNAIIKLFYQDEKLIIKIAEIIKQLEEEKQENAKKEEKTKQESKKITHVELEAINKIIEKEIIKEITNEKDYFKIISKIIFDIFSKIPDFKDFKDFKFSDLDFLKIFKETKPKTVFV